MATSDFWFPDSQGMFAVLTVWSSKIMTPGATNRALSMMLKRPRTADQLPLHILLLYEVDILVADYRFQKWYKESQELKCQPATAAAHPTDYPWTGRSRPQRQPHA